MPTTTNGVIWSAVERFSVQGIQFLLTLVIARLVTPAEYGLVAMLSIFMAIAQTFIDSGFGNALIQKKDRDEVDFSTVFYFNIIIALLCYTLLYFCAPLIASFYNQPELTEITRFVGVNLILMSISIVQNTKLNISLNFKMLSKVSLISVIISGTAGIVSAYHGWGVWALVLQGLLNNAIRTTLLWINAKWKPLFVFSKKSFHRLFSFGSKLLASGLMHTIYLNLYSLVIGKFYNAADVGFYNRAYSISQYPSTNVLTVLTRAIYPVQCEHQNDDQWLETTFSTYLRLSCYIVFPMMCLLAVIAKPLVFLILTEKWLPCADLISILCMAYMLYPIMVINNQTLNVKGRSDLFLKAEIIKKIIAVSILAASIPFGLKWLCIGVVLYNICDVIIIMYYAKKVMNTGLINQIKLIFPIFMINAISMILSWVVLYTVCRIGFNIVWSNWVQLISAGIIFSASYFVLSKVFHFKELDYIFNLINLKRK